jgi:transcriptional regulator with XRE-family HTH domain
MLLNGSQDARDGVGERLRLIRTSKGWSQDYVARRAGVTPLTVSRIEIGKRRRPHFTTLVKIAKALDVEPDDLYDTGTKTPVTPVGANTETDLSKALESFLRAVTQEADPFSLLAIAHVFERLAAEKFAEES